MVTLDKSTRGAYTHKTGSQNVLVCLNALKWTNTCNLQLGLFIVDSVFGMWYINQFLEVTRTCQDGAKLTKLRLKVAQIDVKQQSISDVLTSLPINVYVQEDAGVCWV